MNEDLRMNMHPIDSEKLLTEIKKYEKTIQKATDFSEQTVQDNQDRKDWLQIYCAVIAGRYHIYEKDVQDAMSVMDLTDDWFKDFKDRWEK